MAGAAWIKAWIKGSVVAAAAAASVCAAPALADTAGPPVRLGDASALSATFDYLRAEQARRGAPLLLPPAPPRAAGKRTSSRRAAARPVRTGGGSPAARAATDPLLAGAPLAVTPAVAVRTNGWTVAGEGASLAPALLELDGALAGRPITSLTDDVGCLTEAIYYEARNESAEGQAAVADVVLNRSRDPAFPKTVCGVVQQRTPRVCQFSYRCDGSIGRFPVNLAAWTRARAIAEAKVAAARAGAVQPANATLFYHADYVSPYWAPTLRQMQKIGRHIFYARPGGGAPLLTTAVLKAPLTAAGAGAVSRNGYMVLPALAMAQAAPAAEVLASSLGGGAPLAQ